ncbi:MAG: hypothetical protein DME85_09710 [Verrucomicrobia bacterium]|nr:MAG: hypothetical protein DME85_09710 [Verrucomicrobiota bacterium]
MKVLLPLRCLAIISAPILVLSGCQKETVVTNPDSQGNNESSEKTKPLQAADLVGYDGTKLRKSVDKIKQDNDKHNKELENATEGQ